MEPNNREREDALAACIEVLLMREQEQAENVIAAQLLDTAQVRRASRAQSVARKMRAAAANLDQSTAFCCCAFTGINTEDPQCEVILVWGEYQVQLLGGLDQSTDEAYLLSPDTKQCACLAHAADAVEEEMARLS
ncbi:hypothetical protein FJY94_03045 [Candidatus Kaiserbacteria bacterium]|nr:hypothetical protein [Candidatus Kaiserbacteria bacterium]